MFRDDRICRTNSGISAIRMTTVSSTIDSAQVIPQSGSMNVLSSECHPTRIPDTAQYSGCIIVPRSPRKSSHRPIGTSNVVIGFTFTPHERPVRPGWQQHPATPG